MLLLDKIFDMNDSLKSGLTFGLASGVITTLGLIIGLYFGTSSREVVLAGIITIAFADALSDAFGMHLSVEAKLNHKDHEVMHSATSTFAAKLLIALTFAVPVLLIGLDCAILVCIVWGAILLSGVSVLIARQKKEKGVKIVIEHLIIAGIVIAVSFGIGTMLSLFVL